MSYSDAKTEKQLNKLEKELSKLYKDAYEEMSTEAGSYFEQYKDRWQREYQAFQEGKYTELEFKNWEQTQLARGERWNTLRDKMAKKMSTTNQTASAYINDTTPSIYSLNANYEAYQIAKDTGNMQASWDMIDEQTVKETLMGKNHTEFRVTSVNPKRDYDWNSKQIQQALSAGIFQGKSIDKIADSFLTVMQRNRTSAIRNARTAVTSAQNAGRLNSLNQAKEMGIDVQKKWSATHDERTRFSHALLDGQIRDLDKTFSNGLEHPADANGAPAEVYNCRCTMTYVYPKYEQQTSNELWEKMSPAERLIEQKRYQEWQKSQAGVHKSEQVNFKFENGKIKTESPIAIVTNLKESKKALIDVVGFKKVTSGLARLDEKLVVDVTNQLQRLENKFGVIHRSESEIKTKSIGNAMAYVERRVNYPTHQDLSICGRYFDNYDSLVSIERRCVSKKFNMPCNEEDLSIYSVTHEYGHMIQNRLIQDEMEKAGWDVSNPSQFADNIKGWKWYKDISGNVTKSCYNEIIDIAKNNNPNFSLADNLSEYGRSSREEFFAEVFANSQLGAPNELGKAMIEWLEQKGM